MTMAQATAPSSTLTESLPAKLAKQNEEIRRSLAESQIVEDVCKRRILGCYTDYSTPTVTNSIDVRAKMQKHFGSELKYLPKGNREEPGDYKRRIAMTPFFPQVPDILRDRRGALFAKPPVLDGKAPDVIKKFFDAATTDGKPLLHQIAKSEEEMEKRGWYGVFVDRPTLTPEDMQRQAAGTLSQEEVELRKLDRPYVVFYPAERILDYEYDALGLKFVKVVDIRFERPDALTEAKEIREYRIIDRVNIRVVTTTQDGRGEWVVINDRTIPHNVVNSKTKDKVCPFVIGNSGIGTEETPIGQSMMIEAADADVSATRTLSLLLWCLYIVGTPILMRWLRKGDPQKDKEVNTNVNAYEALQVETQGVGREDMQFCQLDGTGLEMNAGMWEHFRNIGREMASKKSGDAVQVPTEKSGVSKAWDFMTGEQRVLSWIAYQLGNDWNAVLDIVCFMTGQNAESANLLFNSEFDMDAGAENFDVGQKLLDIANKLELSETMRYVLKRLIRALGKIPEEDWKKIEGEINSLEAEKPEPPIIPGQTQPDEENDDTEGNADDGEPNPDDAEDE